MCKIKLRVPAVWLRFQYSRICFPVFLFVTIFRPTLRPPLPPVQQVIEMHSARIKRSECQSVLSPLSSFKVKNTWSFISTFHIGPTSCLCGVPLCLFHVHYALSRYII